MRKDILAALTAFSLVGAMSGASAATVEATPSIGITDLAIGDGFTLSFATSGFPAFSGADVQVSFDSDVLALAGDVGFGDFILTSANELTATPGTSGPITFSRFLAPEVSGDVALFSLGFQAVGFGQTDITLAPIFSGFVGTGLAGTNIAFQTATAVVPAPAVIPLPVSGLLLLTGLAGLALRRRPARSRA